MGIAGLLPALKSIQKPCHLKDFQGQTVAIDAYGWLHKGTGTCVVDLVLEKPTRKHIDYCMRLVRMLQHNGVVPYLVFDGDYLPSKASTEEERKKSRAKSKAAGIELLNAGKGPLAWKELSKAVDVTPEMAKMLINELKKAGVQYIVAPYEADPQMVYLERKGIVSAILSEDSDLLVFGAKCLLTKLDKYGNCVAINQDDFCACKEMDLTGWTEKQFRHMAILSGCDYLASVRGVGLTTAYRLMRKYKTAEQVIRMLQFDTKKNVPKDYLESFYRAELTFLHQRVFCPDASSLVHHTHPPEPLDETTTSFIGIAVESKIAIRVATGELNPITKKPIVIMDRPRSVSANMDNNPTTPWTMAQKSYQRSLSSAGPGDPRDSSSGSKTANIKRMPLGELDVNLFTPSPSQQQALLRNSGDWLAAPYSRAGQRSISTPNLRAAAAAATLNSAPASRPAVRAQTSLTAVNLNAMTRTTEPQSEPRPQKRGRLCSDVSETTSPVESPGFGRSRFFDDVDSPSIRTRAQSKKHKAGIPIFKDEVKDEVKNEIKGDVKDGVKNEVKDGVKDEVMNKAMDTPPDAVEYPLDISFSVILNQNECGISASQATSEFAGYPTSSHAADAIVSPAPVADSQESVPLIDSDTFAGSMARFHRAINDDTVITPFGVRTSSAGISPFMKKFAVSAAGSLDTPPSSGSRIPIPVQSNGHLGAASKSFGRAISTSLTPANTTTPRSNVALSSPLPTPPYTPGTPCYTRNTASFATRLQQAKPKPRSSLDGLPFPEVSTTGHFRRGDVLPNGVVAGPKYGKHYMQNGRKVYKTRDDIPYELRAKYDHGLNKWYEEEELKKQAKEDEWKHKDAPLDEYEARLDDYVCQGQGDVSDDVLSSPPAPNHRVSFGKFSFRG